jgi:hypothetical protein
MSYFYNLLVAAKSITVTRQYQLFDIFAAAALFQLSIPGAPNEP